MSETEPLFLDELQLIGFGESDSTGPWLKFRLADPSQLAVFRGLKGESLPVAIGKPDIEAAAAPPKKPEKGPYGEYWKKLMAGWNVEGEHVFLTDFTSVLELLGTDTNFLGWLHQEPCCVVGSRHDGDIVAAHVRRVNKGAGQGIKPKFSAVPMCDGHHRLQHSQGESAVGGREFFDKQAQNYRAKWFFLLLKQKFGVDSLTHLKPQDFLDWLHENEKIKYLPENLV